MDAPTPQQHRPSLAPTQVFFAWLAAAPRSCPNCRYALTGLTRPVCPECGVKLELRVRSAEPRARAYLAGFIGLSAGLGFAAIMTLLFILFAAIANGSGPDPARFLATTVSGTGVLGTLLFLWHRRRRDLRRLPNRTRVLLAAGACLASLAYVIVFARVVHLA